QLMQVAAAVIQVVQVLTGGKGQCGQVAEWSVVVGQRALVRRFLCETAQIVLPQVFGFVGCINETERRLTRC
ncbi:hypothetical protein CCL07_18315, partial [Pseudomonas congelans]